MAMIYTIKALTTPGQQVAAGPDYALGINSHGHVVGGYSTDQRSQAFFYDGANLHDLDFSLLTGSCACALNDAGLIVGSFQAQPALRQRAFYADGATIHHFPHADSTAVAVNNQRQIVVMQGGSSTYLWCDGTITPLPNLEGVRTQAADINAEGWMVGWMRQQRRDGRGFVYRNGGLHELAALAVPKARFIGSNAFGINDHGVVVGFSGASDGFGHAVRWVDHQIHDLGAPAGMRSTAKAINNHGQIVGYAYTYPVVEQQPRTSLALLWEDDTWFPLNDLLIDGAGWQLKKAVAINDSGQIAGWGIFEGVQRVFLLSPTRPVDSVKAFRL